MYFADKFCSLSLSTFKNIFWPSYEEEDDYRYGSATLVFSTIWNVFYTFCDSGVYGLNRLPTITLPDLTWPDLTWPSHWTQRCLTAPAPDCIIYISARYNIQVRVKFHWVRILYSELWRVCLLYLLITCFCAESMLLGLLQPETV